MLLSRDTETFNIPDRLPVVPLRDVVVFPYAIMPLLIGRTGSLSAVEAAAATPERWIVLVTQRSAEVAEPQAGDLYRIGVVVRLQQVSRTPSGGARVLVEAMGRVRITRFVAATGYLRASVVAAPFLIGSLAAEDRARARQTLARFEEYVGLQRRIPAEVASLAQASSTEERMACAIAAHLTVRHEVRQRLLESPTLVDLLHSLEELITSETDLLRLERKIDDDVRGSLYRNQREFYLQEQLKAIHRELGQEDHDDLDVLAQQVAAKGFPEAARTRADRELRKLRRTPPISPEATVGRNYVDWMLSLPWSERTDDVLDVDHARRVLDEDHFGLDEVKDRILDHIAVMTLV